MPMDASFAYLEHSLRRACLKRAAAPAARLVQERRMGDPTGLSYSTAARRVKRPELQRQLTQLGARAESHGLSKQVLRELLLAAGAGGTDPEHLLDVSRLLESAGFLTLDAIGQVELTRTFARLFPNRFLSVAL
jgi:hypothetical protein